MGAGEAKLSKEDRESVEPLESLESLVMGLPRQMPPFSARGKRARSLLRLRWRSAALLGTSMREAWRAGLSWAYSAGSSTWVRAARLMLWAWCRWLLSCMPDVTLTTPPACLLASVSRICPFDQISLV